MKCYLEITLLPNPEVNVNFLWSKTFQQIHLGLVEMQDEHKQVSIGVSFPEYKMGDKFGVLGSKLRLFANEEATLVRFNASKWLDRLNDYVHCTSIRPVPEKITSHAIYRRKQPKASKHRLARRYARYRQVEYETALQHYMKLSQEKISLPYIRLKSMSSNNNFCLWIDRIETTSPAHGFFSTYGLSTQSTVPEF